MKLALISSLVGTLLANPAPHHGGQHAPQGWALHAPRSGELHAHGAGVLHAHPDEQQHAQHHHQALNEVIQNRIILVLISSF